MRRAETARRAALIVLAGLCATTGCTHYHYYGQPGPYAVPGASAVTTSGNVCEVAPAGTGTRVVVQSPQQNYAVPPGGSRVVISEPQGTGRLSRGGRFAWRKPDAETLATTRVEGAIDDDTKTR